MIDDRDVERGREITRRPTVVAGGCAMAAAVVALAVAGTATSASLFLAGVGVLALAAGLVRGHEGAVDAGSLALFFGVVLGGLAGAPVELTLVGTLGTVVAWDLAGSAVDLGDQLGRGAPTARLEAVHAVSTLLVGVVTVGFAYTMYVFTTGGQPIGVLVLSIVAALLVTIGLGRTRGERRDDARRRGRT